ncbi:MAG: bifunctional oligoribonuclease/PAP phosphatase NrnA [Planctomycetales bacterium]|nr:bifunctional oligoribonuclease/PAP phosphatase NrnA [Planctomycetales bacterium]
MPIDWSPLEKLVAECDQFVLTSHQRADCDALGSELALAGILESLGKQVRIAQPDPVPNNLLFIDPHNKINVLGESITADEVAQADVLMVLDTSAWIQIGPMGDVLRNFAGHKVVVDHHVSSDDLGAIVLKDSTAPATGCLVLEAADALGAEIDQSIAEALFLAISTDTGWFRFPSVKSDTYRQIARLIDAGARPEKLYAQLYERERLARLWLRGHILRHAHAELAGRLMHATVKRADFDACGADTTDTEDAINFLLRVKGSEVALLFVELPDGQVKISFRSRGSFDVRKFAEQFGGGGHTMAAGATVAGKIDQVRETLLAAARQAI